MILNTAAYYQDLKEKMIVDEFHTHKKRLFRMDEEYVALQILKEKALRGGISYEIYIQHKKSLF